MRSLESPSEVSFQLQATLGPLIHIRVEHPISPALLLGPVHCRVGIHEKALRRLRPGITQADAYTGRGEQLTALQKVGSLQFLSDPLCYTHCYLRTLDVLDEYHELAASEAGQAILRTQAPLEPLGDEGEEHIPGLVAQRVVYYLELVQVREEYRHLPAPLAPRAIKGFLEAIHEELAVRKIGQVVVEGPMLEPLLQGLALGKVVDNPLPVERFARFISQEDRFLADPHHRSVPGHQTVLFAEGFLSPRLEALVGGQDPLPIVRVEALGPQ